MTESTYRSAIVFLLSAALFCLALMASSVAALAEQWAVQLAGALVIVGVVGMAAAVLLLLLAARER